MALEVPCLVAAAQLTVANAVTHPIKPALDFAVKGTCHPPIFNLTVPRPTANEDLPIT